MKLKLVVILIIVNLLLIAGSQLEQGKMFFLTGPLIVIFNVIFSLYNFSQKNVKLGVAALVLLFVAPIIGFMLFIKVFQFLTR